MQDTLKHWEEWLRLCTLEKCSTESTEALAGFGRKAFFKAASKLDFPTEALDLPDRKADGTTSTGSASWHYVEDRLLNGHHSSGKSYKAYIVDHALQKPEGQQLNSLRRGFSDQTRNVVRVYYAYDVKEHHKKKANHLFSLDNPIGDEQDSTGHDMNLDFLMAGSSMAFLNAAEKNEFIEIASELVPEVWEQMDHRQKVVVFASLHRVSLAAPEVEEACGCKKSQIYAAQKIFADNVRSICMQKGFEGDDRSVLALQCFMVFSLHEKIKSWAKSEKSITPLLIKAGGFENE